jgi:hypothetical protein
MQIIVRYHSAVVVVVEALILAGIPHMEPSGTSSAMEIRMIRGSRQTVSYDFRPDRRAAGGRHADRTSVSPTRRDWDTLRPSGSTNCHEVYGEHRAGSGGRSAAIIVSIRPNRSRGTATSAIWNTL